MVEVEQSFIFGCLVQFLWSQHFEQLAVGVFDFKSTCGSILSEYLGKDSHVVLLSRVDVHDGFVAKASSPNGEWITKLVLLIGVFNNESSIGSPNIVNVDWHLSTWEEHPVELGEHVLELSAIVVIEQRNHLCSGHL